MKKSKIVLVYPRIGLEHRGDVGLPYGLLTVAAELIDKFNVVLIDQRTNSSWKKRLKKELSNDCLCVGISSMTGTQLRYALEITEIVRKNAPRVPLVWGGVHVTILPEQSLRSPFVDIVVSG